ACYSAELAAGPVGPWHWAGSFARTDSRFGEPVIRSEAERSPNIHRSIHFALGRSSHRGVHPRPPRLARRSNGGLEIRVIGGEACRLGGDCWSDSPVVLTASSIANFARIWKRRRKSNRKQVCRLTKRATRRTGLSATSRSSRRTHAPCGDGIRLSGWGKTYAMRSACYGGTPASLPSQCCHWRWVSERIRPSSRSSTRLC